MPRRRESLVSRDRERERKHSSGTVSSSIRPFFPPALLSASAKIACRCARDNVINHQRRESKLTVRLNNSSGRDKSFLDNVIDGPFSRLVSQALSRQTLANGETPTHERGERGRGGGGRGSILSGRKKMTVVYFSPAQGLSGVLE